jgi:hypothetical protein
LPFTWTQGLVAPPEDLVSADGSATYWAAGKAIRQALRADPNTLEMLFLPDARALDPIGDWLLAERDAFVSVEIYGTFGRYALGQLRRLEQGLRLAEHRTVVLEWLRADTTLTLDAVAETLAKVSTRAVPSEADGIRRAKQYVKQLSLARGPRAPRGQRVRPIVKRALSRRVHRHYHGFAQNRLRFL